MGRSLGLATASFSGLRVGGVERTASMTYIQAHTKNGKDIQQRCIINCFLNTNRGHDRDGSEGRSHRFRVVAWGGLADICARNLSAGKAIDIVCKPHSYEGRLYDSAGNMRIEANGSPVLVERVGFTLTELPNFGEDSRKVIDQEIAEGRRPVNWEVASHPDSATWATMLLDRQKLQFIPGSATFGNARVVVPSGPGVVLAQQKPTGRAYREQAAAGGALPAAGNTTGGALPAAGAVGGTIPATGAAAVDPVQLANLVAQVLQTQAAAGQTGTLAKPATEVAF